MRLENLAIRNNIVAFDVETTGLNGYGEYKFMPVRGFPSRPFEFSFCDDEGNTADIRFEVDPMTRRVVYTPKEVKAIREILEDPQIKKVGFNLSFDIKMSRFSGINVAGKIEDAMYMTHVFTGGSEFKYALKPLSEKLIEFPITDEKDLKNSTRKARLMGKKKGWCLATKEYHGKEPTKADYWMADRELCKKYAISDAERTMLLYQSVWEQVKKDTDMIKIYEQEMRLLRVVEGMETIGTRVFPKAVKELREFYESYKLKQMRIAEANGGRGLNFRSSQQKVKIFFGQRKYEPLSWNEDKNTGERTSPKVDGDALVYFVERYKDKLAKAVLEHNGASHMITGFLNPYDRFKVQEKSKAWVLHPNFRQCGPVTGRFSCGDPNLMNVADAESGRKKAEIDLRIRECLGPRDGYVWYLPDYSQIEVWVFSFLAQDQVMMDILLKGGDFHGELAKQIWGNKPDFEENFNSYRKRAKNIMFCKLYGGGAKKIAVMTNSTVDEAYEFIDNFNSKLPGATRFMNLMSNKAVRQGSIQNAFGRYYFIDANFSYKAINYLVQGSSADILKRSMIRINSLLKERWQGCQLLLTLHDELIIEVPLKFHSKKLMREIIHEMQFDSKVVNVPIPLPVGMKIATKQWSKTTEIASLKDEWKEQYLCKTNH